MTEAEARARIVLYLDPETEPKLGTAEIDLLVEMATRVDENGVEPADVNWTPTFDVNYAVAQGWLVKAGRLAPRYLFMDQGKMFSRQQYYDHCMKLHTKFLMKSGIKGYKLVPDDSLAIDSIPNNALAPFH